MKKLVAVFVLTAFSAFAGERILGLIHTYTTTKSNVTQAPDGGFTFWDGGLDQPFLIPPGAKITVVCQYSTYVCTDATTCTARTGVPLGASVIFPTSVGGIPSVSIDTARNPDAGPAAPSTLVSPIPSAVVSILEQAADGGDHSCQIFERTGRE